MPVAVADIPANLALGEDGVARDDAAIQRQGLEQNHGRGDLVLVGRDRQIADDGAKTGRERRQDVDSFVVEAAAAAQRFAVDGDVFRRALFEGKRAEGAAQGVGIKRLKEIMICRMARSLAGFDIEQAERLGLEPAADP